MAYSCGCGTLGVIAPYLVQPPTDFPGQTVFATSGAGGGGSTGAGTPPPTSQAPSPTSPVQAPAFATQGPAMQPPEEAGFKIPPLVWGIVIFEGVKVAAGAFGLRAYRRYRARRA